MQISAHDFVHLKVHSDFSISSGMAKVDTLVKATVHANMPAVALTDLMNLFGLVKFYSAALSNGIKPIIGCEVFIHNATSDIIHSKLTLLAKNNIGYKHIIQLLSKAYNRGYQDVPLIEKEWLVDYAEGIIILSGGFSDEIGQALLNDKPKLALTALEFYQQHFAKHFYLSVSKTGKAGEQLYLNKVVELAKQQQIPLVAVNDVYFLQASDFDAHEIRVAIHDGYTLENPKRPRLYTEQQFFRSGEEMCQLFADIPQAILNTKLIAMRCNVTLTLGEYFLPTFPTGELTAAEFLVAKAQQGLEQRLISLYPDEKQRQQRRVEYDERLRIELDVINNMGFPGYFLIVMEFIQWSRENDIPVGPGRGSGAGSLVAYSLGITDLDPLAFDLLFERFLNPDRVSMPDFDIDFCIDGRERVIEHIADTYGADAVAQIITFGTLAAKGAIRDVGRVLGHPYSVVDRIAKLIPKDLGITIKKSLEMEPELKRLYDENEEVKTIIDFARDLEGVSRNVGKHAAGLVISPTSIQDFAPIYCDNDGKNPVTHFDKNDVEYIGLVKFDFLGLRNLTMIKSAIDMINSRLPQVQHIDISKIPLDDEKSFDTLMAAETTAVFQLESRGMKELIKNLKPDCFEDIIALVALFRPGPLQSGMVTNFIDRKHGKEEISYPDPNYQHLSLQPILEPTYGIILYQEQVMQIAQTLSGYSLGGADLLRRAMGKKKLSEMAKQRQIFKDGAIANGIDGDLAMKIFDLVEKFAGYGFNKSHSAAYALIAYQTLWLKTHYPAQFMAAVMITEMSDTDKIVGLYDECLHMKLKVIPPDINLSEYIFTVDEKNQIIYGLGAIKGVGEGAVEAIVQARIEGGIFKDLYDLCARIDLKKINRGALKSLIAAGAMDKLGPHRAALDASIDDALKKAEQNRKNKHTGQTDMFGVLNITLESVEYAYAKTNQWSAQKLLDKERDALGFYISGNPVSYYLKEFEHYQCVRLNEVQENRRGQITTVAGLIINVKKMVTKKGNRIGIVTLNDRSANMELKFFGDSLDMYNDLLYKDNIIVARGNVRFDDFSNAMAMTVSEVNSLTSMREQYAKSLAISVTATQVDQAFMQQFKQLLQQYKDGCLLVNLYYHSDKGKIKLILGQQWRVKPEIKLFNELMNLLGPEQVELEFL